MVLAEEEHKRLAVLVLVLVSLADLAAEVLVDKLAVVAVVLAELAKYR
jgi:hypothetical protein